MRRLLVTSLFLLLGAIVGGRGRRLLARLLFQAEIHPTASLGLCILDAGRLTLGPRSRIGHFTVLRNLEEVLLEEDARLGTLNWVYGARGTSHFEKEKARRSALLIRRGGSVTSRHILDCTDTIEIGAFATVAGFRSQILTHSIDVMAGRQSCAPVRIGAFSFLGTGAIVIKGAVFPERSVLSAGSVFSGRSGAPCTLYSGVPAVPVRPIPEDAIYMIRSNPRVF